MNEVLVDHDRLYSENKSAFQSLVPLVIVSPSFLENKQRYWHVHVYLCTCWYLSKNIIIIPRTAIGMGFKNSKVRRIVLYVRL